MGYFGEGEVKRIELAIKDAAGNPYWVDVKTNLKYGDMKNFVNLTKDGVANTVTQLDQFLKAVIKDWNLDDSKGEKAPIDQKHIDQLAQNDAVAIINAAGANAIGDKKADADFLDKSEVSTTPVV